MAFVMPDVTCTQVHTQSLGWFCQRNVWGLGKEQSLDHHYDDRKHDYWFNIMNTMQRYQSFIFDQWAQYNVSLMSCL